MKLLPPPRRMPYRFDDGIPEREPPPSLRTKLFAPHVRYGVLSETKAPRGRRTRYDSE